MTKMTDMTDMTDIESPRHAHCTRQERLRVPISASITSSLLGTIQQARRELPVSRTKG
jgi:hypothetical protein